MFSVEYPFSKAVLKPRLMTLKILKNIKKFLSNSKAIATKTTPDFCSFFDILTRKNLLTEIVFYVRIEAQFIDRGAVSQE